MNREQLLACAWLRWRLTRNQFARGGRINAALSVILIGLLVSAGVASLAGGFLLGFLGLARVQPLALLFTWDAVVAAFLLLWVSGLVVELQRSESLDLTRMLHLPVSLRQVFLFNYLLSHFTPVILLFVPLALGLTGGLLLRHGPLLALMVPLFLGFVFMLSSWTYCLRGWLAALMMNKRRRRALVMWITIGFVLVFQLPNFIMNSRAFRKPGTPGANHARTKVDPEDRIVPAHLFIPPGWVGYGALSLARKNPWPAAGATFVCLMVGALGLSRAYRVTLRFYTAAGSAGRAVTPTAKPAVPGGQGPAGTRPSEVHVQGLAGARPSQKEGILLVERSLPWLRDDTAGLALATFRSLVRAPELKMALLMPVIAGAAILALRASKGGGGSTAMHVFAVTVAAVIAIFAFSTIMSNLFGLDRNGFRALVLLPAPRDQVLLAKNVAFCPFVMVTAFGLMLLAKFFIALPWTALLPGIIQAFTGFILFAPFYNLLSILAPYRLASGTLQAKKPKAIVFLAMFGSMLLTPMLMLPIFVPPAVSYALGRLGWLTWAPSNFLLSLLFLVGAAWLYWMTLPFAGRLLQRAEQRILREVTEETE